MNESRPRGPTPLFVVAASESGARNWARAHGISASRWRYVGKRGDTLRGQHAAAVVLVPGWTSFRTAEEEAATRVNLEAARAYLVDFGAPSKLDPWRRHLPLRPAQSRWTQGHIEEK